MVAISNPFGMVPVNHPTGLSRAEVLDAGIPSGYGTAIFMYQPVLLATAGQIQPVAANNVDFVGVFMGCQFTPAGGRPTYSTFWPASTVLETGTTCKVFYTTDPLIEYEIQAAGSVAQTAIGDQGNFSNFAANGAGYSLATLDPTLAGATVQGQLRIVGLNLRPDNAWGDAFTIVRVQIARHQFVANKVAI
jgi:hypothetical protein